MNKHDLELLVELPLFRGYTTESVNDFLNCNTCRTTEHGREDVVIARGERVNNIGIVLSGSLVGQIESRDGTVTTINYLEKGSAFGDVLSGSSGVSPVTILAKTKCRILWLELTKILEAGGNDKNRVLFFQNYIREISNKYFTLHERVQILSERKMRDKIRAYFSSIAGKQASKTIVLPQRTRSELANFLGCDRSALARELKKMEDEGMIKTNKRIVEIRF